MNQLAISFDDFSERAVVLDSANYLLLQALDSYAKAAMKLGYSIQLWSKSSLQQLPLLSVEKRNEIAAYLNLYSRWIDEAVAKGDGIQERNFLLKALDHYGLSVDEELLETIDDETVVEIYSEDMRQLYRSFKMLDMTGYSLLDLSVFEWYVLWERPLLTIEQMKKESAFVLNTETTFKNLEVAPHVLRETYNTGMTEPFIPRNSLAIFQHIGYLKRDRADAPRAFVCTAKGKVIAHGFAETSQLAFL